MNRQDIINILKSNDTAASEELFSEARRLRTEIQGDKIFAYGFVYFSTFCRNNCNFCYYRRSNDIPRYRKTKDEILDISRRLIESGVNLIDLTMGEDPAYHADSFETLSQIIRTIKNEFDTPVMVSPGVVPDEVIRKLADAGADWYALYQETHNRDIFSKLRVRQSYDERMHAKLYAKDCGMLIEEGLLAGVGENEEDIADSLEIMGKIGAKQIRTMSFIPQIGSPMESYPTPDRMRELKTIALMRIMYPHALIPASLDVDGIEGLEARINAGANLITSIIPPESGLMGVAQSTMEVDEGGRTVAEAAHILGDMGLRIATRDEYKMYLADL